MTETKNAVAATESTIGLSLSRLAEYRGATVWKSTWQLVSTLVVFFALWALAWKCLEISYLLTLLVAIPAGGVLVRLFILAHDCGHGSFYKSRLANDIIGSLLGVLTCTPYFHWRKQHAIHHATSGDLDRRGAGDVHMLTVREYQNLSAYKKLEYRVHRHPLVLFVIGPFFYFVLWQRFSIEPQTTWKERRSIYFTNVALALTAWGMSHLVGLIPFLMVYLPIVAFAASAGVWLFYVQHHYEETYWRHHDKWNYAEAGLQGSSYYVLPRILNWFTADIGLHHIHHLDSHIPNYRLQACYDDNPQLHRVRKLTIWESLRCADLRLWDEDQQKMVGFEAISPSR